MNLPLVTYPSDFTEKLERAFVDCVKNGQVSSLSLACQDSDDSSFDEFDPSNDFQSVATNRPAFDADTQRKFLREIIQQPLILLGFHCRVETVNNCCRCPCGSLAKGKAWYSQSCRNHSRFTPRGLLSHLRDCPEQSSFHTIAHTFLLQLYDGWHPDIYDFGTPKHKLIVNEREKRKDEYVNRAMRSRL